MRTLYRETRCRMCEAALLFCAAVAVAAGKQPAVSPAQNEPNWRYILRRSGLDMDKDLRNPVVDGVTPAGLFRKADPRKPVVLRPIAAWGMETPTHAGWYSGGPTVEQIPADVDKVRKELWTYAYKQPQDEMDKDSYTPPPIKTGSTEFDPGNVPFGLWVSNDSFPNEAVYSQPALVFKKNNRLRSQPYKMMVYPVCEPKADRLIPDSYLIGWEYSTNDDFQDVVMRIDNVVLLPPAPLLKGVLAEGAKVAKLAGGFQFVEGPAWDHRHQVLYFSDIPANQIVRYADGKTEVANKTSGQSNGLMFDKDDMLIACEHGGRRLSRAVPGQPGQDIVSRYEDKRLNSPNDLWIDAGNGIYFTDPRYGKRDDLEQDKEAVYYVSPDGRIRRIIDDLIRPNGIALSPDGSYLYVVDNGADKLYRYAVREPGKLGKGQRIAYVTHPDGMTIDRQGRLYVTGQGGVWVLSDDGKWLGLIETPEQPSNCTFGRHTLFITARTSLYAIDTVTRGWHVHLDGQPAR